MTIKEDLQTFVIHYDTNRQAGHTHTMLHGLVETSKIPDRKQIIIAYKHLMGKEMQSEIDAHGGGKCVLVSSKNVQALRGIRGAITFDNCALYMIFKDSIREIEKLEDANSTLWNNLKSHAIILEDMEDEIDGLKEENKRLKAILSAALEEGNTQEDLGDKEWTFEEKFLNGEYDYESNRRHIQFTSDEIEAELDEEWAKLFPEPKQPVNITINIGNDVVQQLLEKK